MNREFVFFTSILSFLIAAGGGPRIEDLGTSIHGLVILLLLSIYSSCILASPKAELRVCGLNILTGKRISSFNPLKKQLSLCFSENSLILLDKASN